MPVSAAGGRRARRASLRFLLLGACALVPVTGCSFFQQPTNVELTREEVEKISRNQAEAMALQKQMEKQLDELSEAMASQRADSNQQWREIQETLLVLRSQLEELSVRFERMRQGRGTGVVSPAPPDSGATGDLFPPPATGPGSPAATLEAARRDFARGNYQLAVSGFEEYLRLAPESDEADEAQYELANSYYSLGDMDQAIPQFIKVRDLYDGSDSVPAATLKLGYCFLRTGDEATARRYFQMVLTEFPDSEEAPLARDKLATLQ
jgi:tol-pal system protein YbgF